MKVKKGWKGKKRNKGKQINLSKREIQNQSLDRELDKLIKQVNARLKSLYRRHPKGSWASKKLMNYLDTDRQKHTWNKRTGKVMYKKGMTGTQMSGMINLLNNFLMSKTSTHKGIKSVKGVTIDSMKILLSDWDDEENKPLQPTDEELDFLYGLLLDGDFCYIVKLNDYSTSPVWVGIMDAIDNHDTRGQFIRRLVNIVSNNDIDTQEGLGRIYDKYVKSRV